MACERPVVYLASPNTQQQAEHAAGMPVLLSFGLWSDWLDRGYQQAFGRVLIDSGAYSVMTRGRAVDLARYADFAERWRYTADAVAGLDDIGGDWRLSLANYGRLPAGLGFPTIHDTDPPELLADLVPIARERGGWLGVGLKPPRHGKERFVRWVCDSVPDDLHLHGWALRAYARLRRFDSFDSTNWWRHAMSLRADRKLAHLSYGECLDIVVRRYQREGRGVTGVPAEGESDGEGG